MAGAGRRDVSIAIYVPPGPFTLVVGGLVTGKASATFSRFHIVARELAPTLPMTADAREYLLDALRKIQAISLATPDGGWAALQRWTLAQAAGAQTTADTYPALQLAIQRLQDRHSAFFFPQDVRLNRNDHTTAAESAMHAGGPGVLVIPPHLSPVNWQDADRKFASEIAAALQTKVRENQCGLVIDLRENSGGNMWPMLAGIAAVFPDQELGQFVYFQGTERWSARHGRILHDGGPLDAEAESAAHLERTPIAVLVGPGTASSGEAVALALRGRPRTVLLGRPTAGLTTSVSKVPLSDGAFMTIASAHMADGAGHVQEGAIEPELRSQGGQDEVDLARDWLSRHCD